MSRSGLGKLEPERLLDMVPDPLEDLLIYDSIFGDKENNEYDKGKQDCNNMHDQYKLSLQILRFFST